MLQQLMHRQEKKCQNYSSVRYFGRYFGIECLRMVHSASSYITILAIAITLRIVACLANPGSSILDQLYLCSYLSVFIIVFAVAGIGNGNALRLHAQHRFHVALVQRGKIQPYIAAVVCANYVVTILYMVLGGILFALSYGGTLPLIDFTGSLGHVFLKASVWQHIVDAGYLRFTYFMQLVWFGLLAGILSTCSLYLSYRVRNQMFSIVFPSACFYGIVTYLNQFESQLYMFQPYNLFISSNRIWESAAISIIWDLGICALVVVLFERLIYWRVKKDLER